MNRYRDRLPNHQVLDQLMATVMAIPNFLSLNRDRDGRSDGRMDAHTSELLTALHKGPAGKNIFQLSQKICFLSC